MAGSTRGKKQQPATETTTAGPKKRSRQTLDLAWQGDDDDEHIDSSSDDHHDSIQDDESEDEAVDVKRVRLARDYLEQVDAQDAEESSEDDADDSDEDDVLGRKLQRERLKRQGTLERVLADKVLRHVTALQASVAKHDSTTSTKTATTALPEDTAWVRAGYVRLLRGHDLTPTCIALDSSGTRAISGSKDHSVLLWKLQPKNDDNNSIFSMTIQRTLIPHWKQQEKHSKQQDKQQQKQSSSSLSRADGQVLAVALSDDGRFAAAGKQKGTTTIFNVGSAFASSNKTISSSTPKQEDLLFKTFTGHKGAVTCLAFRTQSNQLFSGSDDRCIRHYNLDEMLYMETLYGHQFGVSAIDCHIKERPISVGRDRTARAWKLDEDTHLIFRGGSKVQSAECVSMIKDDWFVTGHEDGHLSLWMTEKKKAVASIENAHGPGNAVVSVASCKGSDVVASGSNDGLLRLWKVKTGTSLQDRGMEPLCQIPVRGFINSIAFGPKARFCVAAVGQEHRCGRWNRVKGAKNRIAIVNLYSSSVSENEDDAGDDKTNDIDDSTDKVDEEASTDEKDSDSNSD